MQNSKMELIILQKISDLELKLPAPIEADTVTVLNADIFYVPASKPMVIKADFIEQKMFNNTYSNVLTVVTYQQIETVCKTRNKFTSEIKLKVFDCEGVPITEGCLYLRLKFMKI